MEGIDASAAMAERLRAKPGGESIPVTVGDMARVPVSGRFRLVYLVFNTLFGLLSQARQAECFGNVARVLEPGGMFVIECFVPDLPRPGLCPGNARQAVRQRHPGTCTVLSALAGRREHRAGPPHAQAKRARPE